MPSQQKMTRELGGLVIAGLTDPGRMRSNNEDNYSVVPEIGLAVLADGMGGHLAGEVASGIAVDIITRKLTDAFADLSATKRPQTDGHSPEAASVVQAIQLANSAIFEASTTRPECAGMGSTIVVAVFYTNKICIAHVGDSRLYRYRDGNLEQMTEDHSMMQELLRRGLISEDEARLSPNKNVVTRALGIEASVLPDVSEQPLREGDLYLLCSDGLTDVLPDKEIAQFLAQYGQDVGGAVDRLVHEANARGGPDNVSIILVRTGKRFSRNKKAIQRLRSLQN